MTLYLVATADARLNDPACAEVVWDWHRRQRITPDRAKAEAVWKQTTSLGIPVWLVEVDDAGDGGRTVLLQVAVLGGPDGRLM